MNPGTHARDDRLDATRMQQIITKAQQPHWPLLRNGSLLPARRPVQDERAQCNVMNAAAFKSVCLH
ncbi:hypothetical protein [Polaromonas sp.]|uniref:hypothetical protein n=1 Tax=Polaromonas sp. TaxID=1869339 RepID=UPI0013B5CFA9|nr:hypothetical protein [Polaromonas sp.]NDP62826.1 hypothetical protein [Polaromonas sp.]